MFQSELSTLSLNSGTKSAPIDAAGFGIVVIPAVALRYFREQSGSISLLVNDDRSYRPDLSSGLKASETQCRVYKFLLGLFGHGASYFHITHKFIRDLHVDIWHEGSLAH